MLRNPKYIKLVNVQGIKNFTYEFPKCGVIYISGVNSAGKSIIRKSVDFALFGIGIRSNGKYKSLLNKDSKISSIEVGNWKGDVVKLTNRGTQATSNIVLTTDKGRTISRNCRDDLSPIYTHLGFHQTDDKDTNIHTHGCKIPNFMVGTKGRDNHKLVKEFTSMTAIEENIKILLEYVHTSNERIAVCKKFIGKCERDLNELKDINLEEYKETSEILGEEIERLEKMEKLEEYFNLDYFPNCEKIDISRFEQLVGLDKYFKPSILEMREPIIIEKFQQLIEIDNLLCKEESFESLKEEVDCSKLERLSKIDHLLNLSFLDCPKEFIKSKRLKDFHKLDSLMDLDFIETNLPEMQGKKLLMVKQLKEVDNLDFDTAIENGLCPLCKQEVN